MAQQINLFDPSLRPQERRYSAHQFARTLTLVAAAMGLVTVYQAVALSMLRSDRAQIERDRDAARKAVAESTAAAQRAPRKELADELQRLDAAIATQEGLLARLNAGDFGTTGAVSPYFTALARQTVSGVWLTNIRVDAASGDIFLRGGLLRADLLPAYLDQIKRESTLRGRSFGQVRMMAHDDTQAAVGRGTGARAGSVRLPQNYVEFELGSARDGRPDETAPPGAAR